MANKGLKKIKQMNAMKADLRDAGINYSRSTDFAGIKRLHARHCKGSSKRKRKSKSRSSRKSSGSSRQRQQTQRMLWGWNF